MFSDTSESPPPPPRYARYLFQHRPLDYHVELTDEQAAFHVGNRSLRVFAGGRGSGKSFIGALDLILRAKPARDYLAIAHNFRVSREYMMPAATELASRMGRLKMGDRSGGKLVLDNGATIWFLNADDLGVRGFSISGAWMDEPSLYTPGLSVLDALRPCLRQAKELGWISATLTPSSYWKHWTYPKLIFNPEALVVRARTASNPYLPPEFDAAIRKHMSAAEAATELDAMFAAKPPGYPDVEA